MKKFFIGAIPFLVLMVCGGAGLAASGVFHPPLAHADAGSPAPDNCSITADDLAAINAAASKGLMPELTARRELLSRVITCAASNATALRSQVDGLQVPDDAKDIQSQLSGKLYDASNYYQLELGKLDDAGIAGTQGIAREVLSWRSANYAPLAAQVDNFSLWVKNQALFTAANDRLSGIEGLVGYLEEAGQNNDLQSNLAAAQSLVQSANDKNAAARNAFLQSQPPDETLAQIKDSLNTLSDAYQKFFDIATIVGNLLPEGK